MTGSAGTAPGRAAVVSFRLGGPDGVSVEAAKWAAALSVLGFEVVTVAGSGPVDRLVPGLAAGGVLAPVGGLPPLAPGEVERALADADVTVVENLCSLPLNPAASAEVARCLRGRPAVLRHHDLPWQRARHADAPGPPDDPAWVHVTLNHFSRRQLLARGYRRVVAIPNCFDLSAPAGDRTGTRAALGVRPDELVLLQPTRALARKAVPLGLGLAEILGATFWLLGPPEEGYGPALSRLFDGARVPIRHGPVGAIGPSTGVAHAYAAADAVVLPSTWEGFGNPALEAALWSRPLAIGRSPAAAELATAGFWWFAATEARPLARFLSSPDAALLDHNRSIVADRFSSSALPVRLQAVLRALGAPGPG